MLAMLVLNYNDAGTTEKLVKKIQNYKILDKIVIVDNHSNDGSFKRLKKIQCKKIDVIASDKNGGYGYGNNFGLRYLNDKYDCDYVLICNPDVFVDEDVVCKCLKFIETTKDCAVVAPMMCDGEGTPSYKCVWKIPTLLQYLTFSLPILHIFGKNMYYDEELLKFCDKPVEVGCVAGSLLMVNLKIMIKYGMYDEDIFLYCEETVLGIKLKQHNYKTYLLPDEKFLHKHSVSINKTIKKRRDQNKLMWESRTKVIIRYYKINFIKKMLVYLLARINNLEVTIVNILRGFL